jgi:hypothetical protein
LHLRYRSDLPRSQRYLLLLDLKVLKTLLSLTNVDLSTTRTLNMTIRLSNNILLSSSTTRELRTLILLSLDLLLRSRRRRVSQFLHILPLLISLEVCLDGFKKFVERVGDGGLEDLRGQDVFAVVGVHLGDCGVDEGFALSALDDEFGLAGLEGGDGEEDVFDETEDAVFLDDLGGSDLWETC